MTEINYGNDRIVAPSGGAMPPSINYGNDRVVRPGAGGFDIDTRGAPGVVRAAVGGAPEADRLATIRSYYPDARPFGQDNFIFTDPQTNRPTLYNPRGLDIGDLYSIRPEAAEAIGGVLGGALAAPFALRGKSASIGIPAAAATGATIGRELENLYATNVEGRVDTRSPERQAVDAATTFGVNAAGGYLLPVAAEGMKRLLGGGGKAAVDRLAAFERQGVEPRAGAVSGSGVVQSAEAAAGSFGGAGVMKDAYSKTIDEVTAAARKAASNTGTIMEGGGLADTLRRGLQQAGERFRDRQETLYNNVYQFFGKQTPIKIDNTLGFLQQETAAFAGAPEMQKKLGAEAMDYLQRLQKDAAGGTIPFEVVRKLRTEIGARLERPVLVGDESRALLKQMYKSLSDDLDAGIASASPGAQKQWELANRYTRVQMQQQLDFVEKMATQEFDKKILSMLNGELGKDGGQLLRKIRYNLTPEQFDDVVASVVARTGVDPKTGAFSPARFTTEWGKMSPEAKNALFGGQRYNELRQSLDDIAKISGSLEDSAKMLNRSNTGRVALFSTLMGMGGGGLGGGLEGAAMAAAAGAVGFGTSYSSALLLANPTFAKWLATGMKIGGSQAAVSAHLGRLSSVAAIEPQLKDVINQYEAAVRSAMPQQPR